MRDMNGHGIEPLPHRVHFVSKDVDRWPELFGAGALPPVEACAERFMGARDAWGVQTYLQLRHRGLDVALVADYVPGAICVTTYEQLQISDRPYDSFVVACRHDRGRPEICEMRIVQNRTNVVDGTDHYLPHWPQPGIQPRDPARGTTVRNVVYHGRTPNLAPPFRSEHFRASLAAMGMTLQTGEVDDARKLANWTDHREADVVLAVRNIAPGHLAVKPPSKLFNAWIAGCPALLGPEPAYRHERRSELDYIEVAGADDALDALRRLQQDPELYTAMVENGFARAAEITPDRIARQWRDLLAGPVARRYEEWLDSSAARRAGRPIRFAGRAVKHRLERRRFKEAVAAGPRPFDDRTG